MLWGFGNQALFTSRAALLPALRSSTLCCLAPVPLAYVSPLPPCRRTSLSAQRGHLLGLRGHWCGLWLFVFERHENERSDAEREAC